MSPEIILLITIGGGATLVFLIVIIGSFFDSKDHILYMKKNYKYIKNIKEAGILLHKQSYGNEETYAFWYFIKGLYYKLGYKIFKEKTKKDIHLIYLELEEKYKYSNNEFKRSIQQIISKHET